MTTLDVTEVLLNRDKASLWAMRYCINIKEDEELYEIMTPLDAKVCRAVILGFRTIKFKKDSDGRCIGYSIIGPGGTSVVDRETRDISVGDVQLPYRGRRRENFGIDGSKRQKDIRANEGKKRVKSVF